MEFGILGPLEVRAGGRAVPLPGAKPRAVLAVLLLHANRSVSAERLALALYGEDAPAGDFLDLVPSEWEVHLPAADFHPGPALALGVETRVYPLETTTWTQEITIV